MKARIPENKNRAFQNLHWFVLGLKTNTKVDDGEFNSEYCLMKDPNNHSSGQINFALKKQRKQASKLWLLNINIRLTGSFRSQHISTS